MSTQHEVVSYESEDSMGHEKSLMTPLKPEKMVMSGKTCWLTII